MALEQLQPFPAELRGQCAQARDVPAGLRQAGDKPLPHGIVDYHEDNGNRAGRLSRHPGRGGRHCHEDLHGELDQLGCERWEPVFLPLRKTIFHDDVLAFHVAEVTQPLPEGLQVMHRGGGQGIICEHPGPGHFGHWLRLGGERCREEAKDERDDVPEDATPHGRLLTSASCRSLLPYECSRLLGMDWPL